MPLPKLLLRDVDSLIPDPANARTHSPEQIEQLAGLMERFGYSDPILADRLVRAGHGRQQAVQLIYSRGGTLYMVPGKERGGMALPKGKVPVIDTTGWTDEECRAFNLGHNRVQEAGGWDQGLLLEQLNQLASADFAIEAIGWDQAGLDALAKASNPEARTPGALAERFGAPPFSVLDTRQGYWRQRRDQWLGLTGNLTETKEGVLASGNIVATINEGSSNFDPVLAELMMRWFCPAGGKVLDPFGGEQTKGVVAGELGLQYHAVEFRQDQVDVNQRACAAYPGVHYTCGDSEGIDQLVAEQGFDLCFTSPPYYDLEVYSADDMSALGTYDEFMAKYERIFTKCVAMMADDSWLVVKVGEIRDRATGIYRSFVPDNCALFTRLGLAYYNEIVLVNAAGTAPQRANRSMATRKMVKLHQNVLVFCKGDPLRAAERMGEPTGIDLHQDESPADA
jgi:hypothetical protein